MDLSLLARSGEASPKHRQYGADRSWAKPDDDIGLQTTPTARCPTARGASPPHLRARPQGQATAPVEMVAADRGSCSSLMPQERPQTIRRSGDRIGRSDCTLMESLYGRCSHLQGRDCLLCRPAPVTGRHDHGLLLCGMTTCSFDHGTDFVLQLVQSARPAPAPLLDGIGAVACACLATAESERTPSVITRRSEAHSDPTRLTSALSTSARTIPWIVGDNTCSHVSRKGLHHCLHAHLPPLHS